MFTHPARRCSCHVEQIRGFPSFANKLDSVNSQSFERPLKWLLKSCCTFYFHFLFQASCEEIMIVLDERTVVVDKTFRVCWCHLVPFPDGRSEANVNENSIEMMVSAVEDMLVHSLSFRQCLEF